MRENFLHYVWKFKKFHLTGLKSADGKPLVIYSVGTHNHNSGPDFFNAKIRIDGQLWVGNVEIHIRSKDWYLHRHHDDPNYDNVILHVVFDHNVAVLRKDNTEIPTLELNSYILPNIYENYNRLFSENKRWINCENEFSTIEDFVLDHWLERLFVERLEKRSKAINRLLSKSMNDWEAVLFKILVRSFGLKINSESFFSIANLVSYTVIRKVRSDAFQLEALLLGQAGLLADERNGTYYNDLKSCYAFLKKKFKLSNVGVIPCQFFRLRPAGFPTIRISQFANLYSREKQLFSKLIALQSKDELYELLYSEAASFWTTHFTFSKTTEAIKKKTTKSFLDLIILNTAIPLKFCYYKHVGKHDFDTILALANSIDSEHNQITAKFNRIKKVSNNALQSQGLNQLKTNYCEQHKCLNCAIGNSLLGK